MSEEGTLVIQLPGKRRERVGVSASLFATVRRGVLFASVELQVDGRKCRAMVDSGCTRTLVHVDWCKKWKRQNVGMLTVAEERWRCMGVADVQIVIPGGLAVNLEAYVVSSKPFGFPCIMGLDAMDELGGVTIRPDRSVQFGDQGKCAAVVTSPEKTCCRALTVEERDFRARFDSATKEWTMEWKWSEDQEPGLLRNEIEEYAIPNTAREKYKTEVREWIQQGWLKPYDSDELGPPKGLIPMMAVIQEAKEKVRPVLDYRELNRYIDAHTREADVCAHKTREWRRRGTNVAMVDLSKAYLQLRVKKELWPYQTVKFEGQQYCLTRLGFGLSVAPLVMKAVLNKVLDQDEEVRTGTSAYVDDILVDEDAVSAERVVAHLNDYGLETKLPERVSDGMAVLGMYVWRDGDVLRWKRRGAMTSETKTMMTRRDVYSLCGKLVGHYPVCGWLRAAVGYVKRRASQSTSRWDDVVDDEELMTCVEEVMTKLKTDDPVKGRWDVSGQSATVWVDASMLAYGAVLEVDGEVIEDASWMRKECTSHINMAELDAVVKGLNLALIWKMKAVKIMTDSATVHRWIEDGLTGKSRLRTKAANEMLIRRRVDVVMELVKEYELDVTIELIPSAYNKADVMTRVPAKWLKKEKKSEVVAMSVEDVVKIHRAVGHPGVRRTWYFAKRKDPTVTRRSVQQVVNDCDKCQSIDPAPVKWTKGRLDVARPWQRVAMDITHVGRKHFLTMIDCGPSRFAIWRELRAQTSEAVIDKLQQVFYDRGAPEEILTDNDTAFKSGTFKEFAADWAVNVRFRAAHVPSGNGIVERCHRTVKTIAARKGCSMLEAVYLYNVTPQDGDTPETAPMSMMSGHVARVRGIDERVAEEKIKCRYEVGEAVWARPPSGRCDKRYDRGNVTRIVSEYTVEVDGIPRHVKDLRRRRVCDEEEQQSTEEEQSEADEDEWSDWSGELEIKSKAVRRSDRLKQRAALLEKKARCDFEDQGGVCYNDSWNSSKTLHA